MKCSFLVSITKHLKSKNMSQSKFYFSTPPGTGKPKPVFIEMKDVRADCPGKDCPGFLTPMANELTPNNAEYVICSFKHSMNIDIRCFTKTILSKRSSVCIACGQEIMEVS